MTATRVGSVKMVGITLERDAGAEGKKSGYGESSSTSREEKVVKKNCPNLEQERKREKKSCCDVEGSSRKSILR